MLDSVHIRLLTYHFVTLHPSSWRIQNIQSNFWRFYMNNRDGAFLERLASPYPLHEGRLYLIPAGVRFDTNVTGAVGHLYAHFDLLGLQPVVWREIFSQPICLPPMATLEQTAWDLMHEMETEEGIALVQMFRIKSILYEGLTLYLQSIPKEQLLRCSQFVTDLEPVLPAVQYIGAHLEEQLLISELAKLCHLHTDYFSRRFRECVGQTPGQYIQEQRIKRAEQQLLLTRMSIEQIATTNGFGNRFYFSRVFANHTGTSPAAYRKGLRGD